MRTTLAGATRASALVHLRRQHELRGILAAFERDGIPVLVLKGMALAWLVYPHPATRPMADLDLMVEEERWEAARDALLGLGLRVPERWQVRPTSGWNARDPRERPFERPGTKVLVELHTRLESTEPVFRLALEDVWQRAVAVDLGGVSARVPHPQDFLLHLVLHLSHYHRFEPGLRPLLDIRLLIERHAWNWPALAAACRAQGSAAWTFLTLKLARDLVGAPVPDAFFAALEPPPRLVDVEALALDQLFAAGEPAVPPGLVTVMDGPSRGERLRHVLRRLSPWRRDDLADALGVLTPAGVVHGTATAWRRLLVDARTRIPLYLSAWARGDLSRSALDRAVRLHRGRQRIEELMSGEPTKRRP